MRIPESLTDILKKETDGRSLEKRNGRPFILAIDGDCGSGKSSLAKAIEEAFAAAVIHMDDYYLPFGKRIPDWRETPAANMDFERLLAEVLEPASAACLTADSVFLHTKSFRPGTGQYEERVIALKPLLVIEGSYSQHPLLSACYDRKVFLTCEETLQKNRLKEREQDNFENFLKLWIPLEKAYFAGYGIPEKADLVFAAESLLS